MAVSAINVGDRLIISFRGLLCGQRIINTFHYGVGTLGSASYEVLTNEVRDVLTTDPDQIMGLFLKVVPVDYTLQEIWMQKLYNVRLYARKYTINQPGQITGATYAANNAAVITRRGTLASRHAVSTLHIPVNIQNAIATEGEFVPSFIDKLNALASAIKDDIETGEGDVLHPVIENDPTSAVGFQAIVDAFAQDTVRVMRRRTLRLGE